MSSPTRHGEQDPHHVLDVVEPGDPRHAHQTAGHARESTSVWQSYAEEELTENALRVYRQLQKDILLDEDVSGASPSPTTFSQERTRRRSRDAVEEEYNRIPAWERERMHPLGSGRRPVMAQRSSSSRALGDREAVPLPHTRWAGDSRRSPNSDWERSYDKRQSWTQILDELSELRQENRELRQRCKESEQRLGLLEDAVFGARRQRRRSSTTDYDKMPLANATPEPAVPHPHPHPHHPSASSETGGSAGPEPNRAALHPNATVATSKNTFSGSRVLSGRTGALVAGLSDATAWRLIFRGTAHGFNAKSFHVCCDAAKGSLVLVKTPNRVFGGFTSRSWKPPMSKDSSRAHHKSDYKCFLFSLSSSWVSVFDIRQEAAQQAIFCHPSGGPCFAGVELLAAHDATTSKQGDSSAPGSDAPFGRCSHVARSFRQRAGKTADAELDDCLLGGSPVFAIDELEVWTQQRVTHH